MQADDLFYSFVDKPSKYHGSMQENPVTWFKSIDRLKKGLLLEDAQVILVASSYLRDAAALWFDSVEDQVTTWTEFKEQFELRFASKTQRHYSWDELGGLEQENRLNSQELIHRLQDLFGRLSIDSDQQRVRYLLKALNSTIAYQVEQFYGLQPGNALNTYIPQDARYNSSIVPSNASEAALTNLANQLAELRGHLVSLTGQPWMHDPARQVTRPAGTRQFNGNCYRCDQPGHRAAECPQPASSENGQERQ